MRISAPEMHNMEIYAVRAGAGPRSSTATGTPSITTVV